MRGFNFNISTLFGNMGSNSSLGSFDFKQYASIKSGSYGKLLKSYYAEQKKNPGEEKPKTDRTNKKTSVEDTTGLSQMKKESDGLKSAVESLGKDELWKQSEGEYDREKITSAVKSFVNEYNDVVKQSSKVNSKDVTQSMHYMTNMTSTMSKALSKVGINVGTDGKMSVDEDALNKANVSSIKSLFTGPASYGSQIVDKAGEISKAALMNSSIYSSNGALSSSLDNMFNKWI